MLKRYLPIPALLAISVSANAAIIDLGNITQDTATGLNWLDVTETRGLSYNEVITAMSAGGLYEGWRYATPFEFDQLVINFGHIANNTSCSGGVIHCDTGITGDSQLIETMINTLGDTLAPYLWEISDATAISPDGTGETLGLLGSSIRNSSNIDLASIFDYEYVSGSYPYSTPGDTDDRVRTLSWDVDPSIGDGMFGSYLVQDISPIPVPGAVWLFGSGLIGLICMAKRKKV